MTRGLRERDETAPPAGDPRLSGPSGGRDGRKNDRRQGNIRYSHFPQSSTARGNRRKNCPVFLIFARRLSAQTCRQELLSRQPFAENRASRRRRFMIHVPLRDLNSETSPPGPAPHPPFTLLDPYIRTKPHKHWGFLRSDPYHDPYQNSRDPYQSSFGAKISGPKGRGILTTNDRQCPRIGRGDLATD